MKPENLLVFLDYAVKLGDLGVSVKIPSDQGEGKGEAYLKGFTAAYANQEMKEKCEGALPVSKEELFSFDRYSLWKTFQKILKLCKEFPISPYFVEMVEELNPENKTETLQSIYDKYHSKYATSYEFIDELCMQLFLEGKIYAINNAVLMASSKMKNFLKVIQDTYNYDSRMFLSETQFVPIGEDTVEEAKLEIEYYQDDNGVQRRLCPKIEDPGFS